MKTASSSLTTYLEVLCVLHNLDIAQAVAFEALQYDNPHSFFNDLAENGCISGMVGTLVYYADTYAFFDRHYAEIEVLRQEYELVIPAHCNLKNFLSWFAFEAVAYQIYNAWEQGD